MGNGVVWVMAVYLLIFFDCFTLLDPLYFLKSCRQISCRLTERERLFFRASSASSICASHALGLVSHQITVHSFS